MTGTGSPKNRERIEDAEDDTDLEEDDNIEENPGVEEDDLEVDDPEDADWEEEETQRKGFSTENQKKKWKKSRMMWKKTIQRTKSAYQRSIKCVRDCLDVACLTILTMRTGKRTKISCR